ncbi:glycosyltransferase family 9 protein [bacterium]|nr:MAG: glycosyltransferase family 9 protein [bacterium]
MRKLERALVICAGGGAGDVLLATPVARALRAAGAREVVALTAPRHRDVLFGNPDLHEVWLDDADVLTMARRLRAAHFDAAIVTWATQRYALLPLLAGIPLRVGQARRTYSLLFNRRVTVRSELGDRESHWTQILLDYARAAGCPDVDPTPSFRVDEAARAALRTRIAALGIGSDGYVVLHPTRGLDLGGRPWPIATLASLAARLRERFSLTVLVSGTEGDRAIAEEVARGGGARSLAGETTFGELAALLEGARLCVAVDSGPMHLAACLGTPTIGIFALQTDEPRRWAPLGPRTAVIEPIYPCPAWHRKENCPDFACLRELDPERVIAACEALLTRV